MTSSKAAIALTVLIALPGCGRSDTGVQITAHLGSLEYDELRFRVTGSETLVDPETNGRFLPPFPPGDQSVVILLSEALDGIPVHCEASAWRAGASVADGAGDFTVARHQIRNVEIFMATGGAGGTGGMMSGTGGTTPGTGGTTPQPARGNGENCSVEAECLSGKCVDGVCCESDCQMGCHACSLPESKGLCRPVPAGTPDPRAKCKDEGVTSCKTNGLCGVAGACAVYPAGTVCEPASCTGNGREVVPARTCDGDGRCQEQPKLKCPEPLSCVAGVCS